MFQNSAQQQQQPLGQPGAQQPQANPQPQAFGQQSQMPSMFQQSTPFQEGRNIFSSSLFQQQPSAQPPSTTPFGSSSYGQPASSFPPQQQSSFLGGQSFFPQSSTPQPGIFRPPGQPQPTTAPTFQTGLPQQNSFFSSQMPQSFLNQGTSLLGQSSAPSYTPTTTQTQQPFGATTPQSSWMAKPADRLPIESSFGASKPYSRTSVILDSNASPMECTSIVAMPEYQNKSPDELRHEDYTRGKKPMVSQTQPMGMFNQSMAQPFQQQQQPTFPSSFGTTNQTSGPFGGASLPSASSFQTQQSMVDQNRAVQFPQHPGTQLGSSDQKPSFASTFGSIGQSSMLQKPAIGPGSFSFQGQPLGAPSSFNPQKPPEQTVTNALGQYSTQQPQAPFSSGLPSFSAPAQTQQSQPPSFAGATSTPGIPSFGSSSLFPPASQPSNFFSSQPRSETKLPDTGLGFSPSLTGNRSTPIFSQSGPGFSWDSKPAASGIVPPQPFYTSSSPYGPEIPFVNKPASRAVPIWVKQDMETSAFPVYTPSLFKSPRSILKFSKILETSLVQKEESEALSAIDYESPHELKKLVFESPFSPSKIGFSKTVYQSPNVKTTKLLDSPSQWKMNTPTQWRKPEGQFGVRSLVAEGTSPGNIKVKSILDSMSLPEDYFLSASPNQSIKEDGEGVRGLTIGHRRHGKIEFLEPVNLREVPFHRLSEIVVFAPREVVLYPNSDDRPEFGHGLNFPAEICLHGCRPPHDFDIEKQIEKLRSVPGTEFRDFVVETGTWIFRVKHF